MKINVTLEGLTAYSANKADGLEAMDGENDIDLENRRKLERAHRNSKGEVVIPAITFVNMLASTAKRIGMRVPGNKAERYTKSFVSGVIPPLNNPILKVNGKSIKVSDIGKDENSRYEPVYCHSDGKREGGKGTRVVRHYPLFENWAVDVDLEIIDPKLSEEIVLQHLVAAGMYNGLGRFRPQNRGTLGRFKVIHNGKPVAQTVTVASEEE